MADSHVVSGLKAKRLEILSEIDRLEGAVAALRADVLQIEAAIRIVSGDPAAKTLERLTSRKRLFERGEAGKIIFAALRRSERPLSTAEIVSLIAAERGEDQTDKLVMSTIMNRVGKTLGKYRHRGHVLGERRGNMTWWRLPPAL